MHPTNSATDFYDMLAPLFDVMTDWDARLATEGPFLRHWLEAAGAKRVLDAACGSGGHALALAGWGYDVTGADISPVMVDLARNKATTAGVDVRYTVAGLAELPARLGPERFDAVLCLGNSLPHLLDQAELVAALRGVSAVLRPAGLFIAQNLNYDLRWQKQPRFFAAQGGVLDDREVLVWRFADYDVPAGRIAFNVALFRKEASGWNVQVQSTPQRPLFRADLVAALAEAGFQTPEDFGQMALPAVPFDAGRSGDLVVVARRNG